MLKDTIISAFNYDGTLLKWLKKVQEALENASASEFRVNKKGNATISFSIVFANGDTLESGDIVLQQGESVTNATIRQGHLILTLSNGDELDAGDVGAVTGFSINGSQHLIVTYQNGTTQDLGAIFTGNVTISGNLTVTNKLDVDVITSSEAEIRSEKPIVELMQGYSFTAPASEVSITYAGVVKNANKITFAICGMINKTEGTLQNQLGVFRVPSDVWNKLYGGFLNSAYLDVKPLYLANALTTGVSLPALFYKSTNTLNCNVYGTSALTPNTDYFFRYEVTFLLSQNLA